MENKKVIEVVDNKNRIKLPFPVEVEIDRNGKAYTTDVYEQLTNAYNLQKDVLNIIINKRVNMNLLLKCWKLEQYNSKCALHYDLTQEEFTKIQLYVEGFAKQVKESD